MVSTKDARSLDATGIVSFIAAYSEDGQDFEYYEVASFRKEGTNWLFVEGRFPKPVMVVKTEPDLDRNEPCHCGSGKEFRKCDGN